MTPINDRLRETNSTRRRSELLLTLIAELRTRSMTAVQIMTFLNYSKGGARKYIIDLLAANIVTVTAPADDEPGRSPIYELVSDEPRIAAFVALISTHGAQVGAARPGLHIMADDEAFRVKQGHKPVARDPLHVAFFGPARGAA